MELASSNKNVTIDDVRVALGETDPHQTNSSKLRNLIGRGSLATIQKYLDTIRAEVLAAQQPAEVGDIPAMPDDFAGLWRAAYTHAVAIVRARLDAVVSERDALLVTVASARADVESLDQLVEESESLAHEQAARIGNLELQIAELSEKHAAALAELTNSHDIAIDTLETELSETRHAAEIASRDHLIAEQKHAALVDRLTDQIGELKSLLHASREQPETVKEQPE